MLAKDHACENERRMTRLVYLFNNSSIEACGANSMYDSSITTMPSNNCRMFSTSSRFSKLPVGFVLYLRMWRFRLRLWKDLQRVKQENQIITDRIRIILAKNK